MDRHEGARIGLDGSAEDLTALTSWLTQERALRGRVRQRPAATRPGEMGATTEIVVGLLSTGAVVQLATSLQTWLEQRRSDVRLTVTSPDGRSVELDVKRATQARELVLEVLNKIDSDAATVTTYEQPDHK